MWFKPYSGRNTLIKDHGLGQGPKVVLSLVEKAKLGLLSLVEKAKLGPGSEVYFDNLFTSFPLLEKLSEKQIAYTGTVRQNHLYRVDIISKKDMEKKTVERGTSHLVYRKDQVLVAWKDNKAVYVCSNKDSDKCNKTCRQWCCISSKYNTMGIPDMIGSYNENMGGVELINKGVACYRSEMSTYLCLFIHYFVLDD